METPDKHLEAQREATVDRLIMNYGHGKLSRADFEQRLDQALAAQDFVALQRVADGLELEVDDAFLAKKQRDLELEADEDGGDTKAVSYVLSLCGHNSRRGQWQTGKEIRVINLCGGATLDFREADFTARRVRVRLYCVCGGVSILVPEGVNVTSRTFCIMGGFHNRAPNVKDATRPTIEVEGIVLCGGAGVRVKMSRRERLMHFATALKEDSATRRKVTPLRQVDTP